MTRSIKTMAVAALCVTGGAHAATQPLEDFKLDVNQLATQGTQRYGIQMHGRAAQGSGDLTFRSHLTMTTYFEGGRFVLADEWDIMGRNYSFELHCRPNGLLQLDYGVIKTERHGEASSATIEVQAEVATVGGDADIEMPYPSGTVAQAALFRIIPQLPREAGSEFTFSGYSEAIEMEVKTPAEGQAFRITCKGKQQIDVDGSSVPCTLYTVDAKGTLEFFVDANAQIRKVVADGGDTVLTLMPEGVHAASVDPAR